MKTKAYTSKLVETTTKIECNKCGDPIHTSVEEYYEGYHRGGYNSYRDGNEYEFDICEDCLFEFIDSFEIKALTRESELIYD